MARTIHPTVANNDATTQPVPAIRAKAVAVITAPTPTATTLYSEGMISSHQKNHQWIGRNQTGAVSSVTG
jgi:hypothetical protein